MAPTAQTSFGTLQGTDDGGVAVFRGIPFAMPPLGPLRFRPPQPPAPWSGVRDATAFGPAALQPAGPAAALLGMSAMPTSEDCLYLNVWTPAADAGKRPVLVWIHGGGFTLGSGAQTLYNGSRLASRGDAVVVTFNYRLGAFGFLRGIDLCGDALSSTGNEGLLDQVAALTWVRDEIATFGGDPGNVTVFGESAGSISLAALLTMPAARGLFHKAILESGSLNLLIDRKAANATMAGILEDLNLSPEEAGKLRELPAADLLQAQVRTTPSDGGLAYAPIADGAAIPLAPFDAIAAGAASGAPLLIGTNLEEMKLFGMLAPDLATLDEAGLRKHTRQLLSGNDADAERAIEVYTAARAARGADVSPKELWYAIWTDGTFRAGAMRLAELYAATTSQTYAYLFTWKSPAMNGALGACHALELPFVFGTLDDPGIGQFAGGGPAVEALSTQIQDAWLAFARTGNPATESLPAWPVYAPPRRATMVLGPECKEEDAPLDAELAFWRSIGK